jgi:hypothetical protein
MTSTTQLDYPQDRFGDSLNTPLGTETIPRSMPVSATILLTEPGADKVPEPDRTSRSTVACVAALVAVTAALGLFAWFR